MSDPTMDFLNSFKDRSRWVVRENVPVFIEHETTGKNKDGSVRTIKVGAKDLDAICANYRRLEHENAVVPALTIGHTDPDPRARETSQPDIVGYARDLKVGTFGPSRKRAILATFYFRKDRAAEAAEYPFRSPEYYDGTQEITKISLLKRDPRLDMGVVTYQREGRPFLYQSEINMPDMPQDPTVKPGEAAPPNPEDQEFEKFMRYMKRYQSECAAPPAPAPGGGGTPPAPPPEDAARMQRETDAIRYARIERENADTKQRLEALQLQYARTECEALVKQLVFEGYEVDHAAELAKLVPLDAPARSARMDEVRRYHRKDPTAGDRLPVASGPAGKGGEFTDRHLETAQQYMRETNQKTGKSPTWSEAREYALANTR